jgi:hypothetical protein
MGSGVLVIENQAAKKGLRRSSPQRPERHQRMRGVVFDFYRSLVIRTILSASPKERAMQNGQDHI